MSEMRVRVALRAKLKQRHTYGSLYDELRKNKVEFRGLEFDDVEYKNEWTGSEWKETEEIEHFVFNGRYGLVTDYEKDEEGRLAFYIDHHIADMPEEDFEGAVVSLETLGNIKKDMTDLFGDIFDGFRLVACRWYDGSEMPVDWDETHDGDD